MSKRSILVVDDDRSVRSYLSDFLSSCGYGVESAESGDQAVARLTAGFAPSLIILDVVMPGINGIEALESVKKINSSIPVIILSAAGQTKTVVDAMKMGASDFLVKPFEEQELELAIENAFEKQKLKEYEQDTSTLIIIQQNTSPNSQETLLIHAPSQTLNAYRML